MKKVFKQKVNQITFKKKKNFCNLISSHSSHPLTRHTHYTFNELKTPTTEEGEKEKEKNNKKSQINLLSALLLSLLSVESTILSCTCEFSNCNSSQ